MAKAKIVTDISNKYFTNNKINIGTAAPTTGTYKAGDMVISSSANTTAFGWICTAAGTPGTWKVLQSGTDVSSISWGNVSGKPSTFAPVIGTTSTTAFRGDYGNTAYNHSQAAHAPSNAQKNSDITKAEIEAKLTGTITSHTHTADSVGALSKGVNTVATGTNVLSFNGSSKASFLKKITDQGGIGLACDSSMVLHSGDRYDDIITGLGITNTTSSEYTAVTADGVIKILPGQQDGYNTAKLWEYTSAGNLNGAGEIFLGVTDGNARGFHSTRRSGTTDYRATMNVSWHSNSGDDGAGASLSIRNATTNVLLAGVNINKSSFYPEAGTPDIGKEAYRFNHGWLNGNLSLGRDNTNATTTYKCIDINRKCSNTTTNYRHSVARFGCNDAYGGALGLEYRENINGTLESKQILYLDATAFSPNSNGGPELGKSGKGWKNLWLTGHAMANGKKIHVLTSAPSGPATGEIWIQI